MNPDDPTAVRTAVRTVEGDAPAAAGGRRSSPRGRAAAERILEIARQAFAERGYRGTSLNEIAKSSGLSMPGLLHHFGSKDVLFRAVMDRQEETDTELFAGFVAPDARLFEMLDAFVAMARVNVQRYSFVQFTHLISAEAAPGGHPGTEVSREHYRRARLLVADACRLSQAGGQVTGAVDPVEVAYRVVAMVEGLQNQWLLESSEFDYAEVFAAWVEDYKRTLAA